MTRSLKFCMISIYYPPYSFGGDGIYLYRLCNELARKGHEVDVIHCADSYHFFVAEPKPDDFPVQSGITLHRLKSPFGPLAPLLSHQTGRPLLTAPKIARVLASKRFDVVHYHNVSLFGPSVFAIEPGYPSVKFYTAHDHWLVCPTNVLYKDNSRPCDEPTCFTCTLKWKRPPQLWRYGALLNRSLRHIDRILTPSQFCADMLTRRGIRGEMRVLPDFVPVPEAAPGSAVPHARPYFLFVGRLEKIKGLQDVLPLFQGPGDYDLLVIGSGPYEAKLRRMAAGLPRVRFLGWKSPGQMGDYFQHALALVVPSVTYETFGIVVIEAYAYALPVIARDLGPLPEVVREGGLLYRTQAELRANLDRLAGDPRLREQLADHARQAYREKWTAEAHLRLYEECISEAQEQKFGKREPVAV